MLRFSFLVLLLFCFCVMILFFFFSSRRRHTRSTRDWSSDVCSSDLDSPQEKDRKGSPAEPQGQEPQAPTTVSPDPSDADSLKTAQPERASKPSQPEIEIGRASCRERV